MNDWRLGEVLTAGWNLERRAANSFAKMTVEEVRWIRELVHEVDLSMMLSQYIELVRRLRRAGIPVSDRRAVKLQRLVAASAAMCGRLQANTTDLWVLRYTWDIEEQREVIAGIVQEFVEQSGEDALKASHPRARNLDGPNPEELARDLEQLANRIQGEPSNDDTRSVAREQLGLLAGRCQWVRDDRQRCFLEQQVQSLWTALSPTSGSP
jgi:MoxR-like ATPase